MGCERVCIYIGDTYIHVSADGCEPMHIHMWISIYVLTKMRRGVYIHIYMRVLAPREWILSGSLLDPFGSLRLPFGFLLAPFGSLLAACWLPLVPFGSPLAPCWLPSDTFGSILDPCWLLVGSLWLPFGSLLDPCWLPVGTLWLLFGSLWLPFGSLLVPF